MKLTKLIFTLCLTQASLIFSQNENSQQITTLTPSINDGDYCFDSLQIREVAKIVEREEALDSTVIAQDSALVTQDSLISSQERRLETLHKTRLKDSTLITASQQELENTRKKCDLTIETKVNEQKHKNKKVKKGLIGSVILNLLLILIIL